EFAQPVPRSGRTRARAAYPSHPAGDARGDGRRLRAGGGRGRRRCGAGGGRLRGRLRRGAARRPGPARRGRHARRLRGPGRGAPGPHAADRQPRLRAGLSRRCGAAASLLYLRAVRGRPGRRPPRRSPRPGFPSRLQASNMSDFATLRTHAQRLADTPVARLLQDDPARARDLALRVGPLYASFARQRYDAAALDALHALAEARDFAGAMRRLLDGETVNTTEGRAALHSALRGEASQAPVARECSAQAAQARARMGELVDAVSASGVTDVVSVGIGGSDLGPRLVVDALAGPEARVRVHFLSNVDGNAARRVLAGLDPAKTAAILISKTFGTQETLLNGRIVRDWLGDDSRVYGVSANVERAVAFGIAPERILPMWDWVG